VMGGLVTVVGMEVVGRVMFLVWGGEVDGGGGGGGGVWRVVGWVRVE